MTFSFDAIPEEWIKQYVDKLLKLAESLTPGSAMQRVSMERAANVMDMVNGWRETRDQWHAEK